jgi:sugar/nucleoside kinase (ribokinase family)
MAPAGLPKPGQGIDVVGVGENSVDLVYRLAAAPAPNSKQRITSHRVAAGGQVATAMCTCAALGLRVTYAGVFGDDDHGRFVRRALTSRGVDVSSAPIRGVANRHAVILVDERTGDRTVLWDRHPRLHLSPDELPDDAISSARVVHVDDVDLGTSIAAAGIARGAGAIVTSDIDRVVDRTDALIEAVTIPIMAEHVPAALTGEADAERALRKLRQRHPGMLCVTLGRRGAMLLDGDVLHHAPAPQVEVVDSTGAGDVFRGAFIYALLRGETPLEILRFANAAAALSCTREGAIDSVASLPEIERFRRR